MQDHRRGEQLEVNATVYTEINNDARRCGFAGSQATDEVAHGRRFPVLDWFSNHLTDQRYPLGDNIIATGVRRSHSTRPGSIGRKALRARKASRAAGRA